MRHHVAQTLDLVLEVLDGILLAERLEVPDTHVGVVRCDGQLAAVHFSVYVIVFVCPDVNAIDRSPVVFELLFHEGVSLRHIVVGHTHDPVPPSCQQHVVVIVLQHVRYFLRLVALTITPVFLELFHFSAILYVQRIHFSVAIADKYFSFASIHARSDNFSVSQVSEH